MVFACTVGRVGASAEGFFAWYNREHRHSAIGLLTPETVHLGKAELVTSQRELVLASAFDAHPERSGHVSVHEIFRSEKLRHPEVVEAIVVSPVVIIIVDVVVVPGAQRAPGNP